MNIEERRADKISICGVCTPQIVPAQGLIQGTADGSMDFFNHAGRNGCSGILAALLQDRGCTAELLVKALQLVGGLLFASHEAGYRIQKSFFFWSYHVVQEDSSS